MKTTLIISLLSVAAVNAQPFFTTMATSPSRTIVSDANGWAATFTDGARTVLVRGVQRNFHEVSLAVGVTFSTNRAVRLLPSAFDGIFDAAEQAWLTNALANPGAADLIDISMQYIPNAPTISADSVFNGSAEISTPGKRIAGDADYGPLPAGETDNSKRKEGSDFNDFLAITYHYGNQTDSPEADQTGALDCSGYMRMVWGFRGGMPMTLNQNGGNGAIPRRAIEMMNFGPGVLTVADTGAQVTDMNKLQVGHLVFFDSSTDDGTVVDHVGMYIGTDSKNNHRFISSRKKINGPTFAADGGDLGGRSILNGTGWWAVRLRAARRF